MALVMLLGSLVALAPPAEAACALPAYTSSLLAAPPATGPVFPQRPNKAAAVNEALWGDQCRPLPTNTWWTNMMVSKGEFPVLTSPYLVIANTTGLAVSYPYPLTATTAAVVSPWMVWPVTLGAAEGLKGRVVQSYDPLTVTLLYKTATGSMTVPLAQGSPYISAIYSSLSPEIRIGTGKIRLPVAGDYTSAAFALVLSTKQVWRVYFGAKVSVTITGTSLIVNGRYTGAMRVALVPSQEAMRPLDLHSDAIPTRCALKAGLSSANRVQYSYQWSALSLRTPGRPSPQKLLMLALPHHMDAKASSSGGAAAAQLQGAFRGLLGPYAGLLGDKWTITEKLPVADWQAPRPPAASKVAALKAVLATETDLRVVAPDPYFGASQVAAVGQQALIADALGEPKTAAKLRATLKEELDKYLRTANGTSRFVYDTTYGGIVSVTGVADAEADFGNGAYNDHHFHYGYLLYAAAALGVQDRAWLLARRPALLNIVRDFANPRQGEQYFPFARHMDFYAGHSWAAGPKVGLWDVQNQESSSEAVHAYYALALLGRALGDTKLANWGRLLMAIEIRGAQKYYQVPSTSTVYPEPFKSNKVVGMLWSTKVVNTTWFGSNTEFIHCIQHIPYRPHTEALLPAAWINETLPLLLPTFSRAQPPIPSGFGAFVRMVQAIVDPEAAFTALQTWEWQWNGPHAAMTRTAALWWAATRPGAV